METEVADALKYEPQRFGAADFQPHARIELQRAATRRGLRIAEEHADLLSDLVDEDDDRMALGDRGRELTQRLGHEPGLHTRQGVAHVPFDLRSWHERGHGVDDDQVHGAATHQHLGDFQRLLAGIRLRDQQVLNVHATGTGPHRVERVLGINEGGNPAGLLRRGDHVQRKGRLPTALRAVNLDHPTAGQTANPQGDIEGDNARRDDTGVQSSTGIPQPHDRSFAKLTLDLADRLVHGLIPFTPFFLRPLPVQLTGAQLGRRALCHHRRPFFLATSGRRLLFYSIEHLVN